MIRFLRLDCEERQERRRIKNASAVRGTSMHKYLENYVLGKGYEDLTELGQETKRMAEKVIEVGLAPVSGYYGSEVTVYYPGSVCGLYGSGWYTQRQRDYYRFQTSKQTKERRVDW